MNYRKTIHRAQRNTINVLVLLQNMSEDYKVDLQGLLDAIDIVEDTAKELQALFDKHTENK